MVKDEDGKLKDDLPKPNSKDDADLANASVEEWKLMKKQIREIGKIQAQRMEQAMVTGRRWKMEEWEMLLAKHPLMTHIAKTLLWWVCFPDREKSIEVFRLTEERDYADIYDKSLNLQGGAYVGLVHPLLLSQEEKKTGDNCLAITRSFLRFYNWEGPYTFFRRKTNSNGKFPDLRILR
ncbi:PF13569 domain protein [Leptospira weilii str. Ecochallenge]|uniref:PF13569 domain protein n=1 Tax=Leptospira weilii str. Ecochallenge TaxID=1049986 RepID=N1U5M6_9LEPT|nr:PF13569 domain protein [Leptospira weilii str. Ecochallenge]